MADLLPEIITVGIAKTGRLYWFGGLFKTPEMHCKKEQITVERKYRLVHPPVNHDTSDMVLEALEDAFKAWSDPDHIPQPEEWFAAIKKSKGE